LIFVGQIYDKTFIKKFLDIKNIRFIFAP